MSQTLSEQFKETKESIMALLKDGKQTEALALIQELEDCMAVCESSKKDVNLLREFSEVNTDQNLIDDPEASILKRLKQLNPDFVPSPENIPDVSIAPINKFFKWLNKGKTEAERS
ncbi:MAG TPA: hypothetical protein PLO25_01840 [Candidatus Saccharibacteria bacterium]|nr:hypothetical protein [Candidatus Saccharibacteria bacterium]